MHGPDLLIYVVHGVVWTAFGITLLALRPARKQTAGVPMVPPPAAANEKTARFSRTLVAFHAFGFGLLYLGMGQAVIPGHVRHWFDGQRMVGGALIAAGGALMIWARLYFRSWRFRAKLDAGHELATGGPFRLLRHPIYAGLILLALGTAIWVPNSMVWAAAVLVLLGSDLRARSEEQLLSQTFGGAYREYCQRTRRFIPAVY